MGTNHLSVALLGTQCRSVSVPIIGYFTKLLSVQIVTFIIELTGIRGTKQVEIVIQVPSLPNDEACVALVENLTHDLSL